MQKRLPTFITFLALTVSITARAQSANSAPQPRNFIFAGGSDLSGVLHLLSRPDIEGVQVLFNWKELEPRKEVYDFSAIDRDLAIAERLHKKLFIQIQDRFFHPIDRNIPAYLLNDPIYGGGLVVQSDNPGEGKSPAEGWAAEQWNPNLRKQYQKLLRALAARFDGKVYGINLPETSVDLDENHPPAGFTCDAYFDAEIENMNYARNVFKTTYVVQYINFWPCDWSDTRHYMARAFADAAARGIGMGGPDIVPYRPGQMSNSCRFFHEYKGKLPLVAMAVQEPTLTYTNPQTHHPFTKDEFIDFARDYLGVDIVFWAPESPWLNSHRYLND